MIELGFHCNRLHHVEERVLGNGLQRGEFYNFPREDIPTLKAALRHYGIAMSIHTPLVKPDWYPNPPTWTFLCDLDPEKRNLSLRMVADTMAMAEDFGAEYVVVHFPVPPSEATSQLGYPEWLGIAMDSCHKLVRLSEAHGIPIHIEGFGPSPFLNATFLSGLFMEFPVLRYCFDTGHMHLSAQRDGFDYFAFAQEVLPYIGSVHLWNNRGLDDYRAFRHIPVHPSQDPAEGWVDIERTLKIVAANGHPFSLIFESGQHYPQALGDYDYRDGVIWVKGILETLFW